MGRPRRVSFESIRWDKALAEATGSDRALHFSHTPRDHVSDGSKFRRPENVCDRMDLEPLMERRRARLAELGFPT